MTPQTKYRRSKLIDQIITNTALDYRFDDKRQPILTEDLKAASEESITAWNGYADQIDKWAIAIPRAARKFANGYIGLRLHWSDALAFEFRPTAGAIREGAELPAAYWRAMGALDNLADHLAKGATRLTVPLDRVHWMADFLFVSMIPQEVFDRAAHTKGHIWDRRLRHTKRAKARRQKAFIAETSLALEDARQEAEFISLLREARRKADRFYRDGDVLKDRDISIARPNVRVVQLGDHIGFMLPPPPPDRAK